MQLEPRQFSTLEEMGIPVWELRHSAGDSQSVEALELTEQQLKADWLIVFGKENHTEQKQQLLAAMLLAIGVDMKSTATVDREQLPLIETQNLTNKQMLVFGKQFQSALNLEQSDLDMHKLQTLSKSGLNMIVTHDLSDVIQQPEKKRDVWQALKLAQQLSKQFN